LPRPYPFNQEAVRTLVISDLHLGQGGGVSALTRPEPLAALLEALDSYDRLVLLGDIVELEEAGPRHSMMVAEPVLRTLAARLGPSKQIVLVAGNHDHDLIRDWAAAPGAGLTLSQSVPLDASPLLAQMGSWLRDTQVEVRYPGVWLTDRVYAIHGHYLNNYLKPVSSYGLHLRKPLKPATPADLELPYSPAPTHMRDGLPPERWVDAYIPARLSRVSDRLLGHQMVRHSLPAFAMSLRALGVDAEWVVFGHVHRRGPREGDAARRWRIGKDGPRLVCTGSWRYEPVVSRGLDWRSRYWPGGGVIIGEDGVPRSVGLLDGLSESQLLAE
jgi:predicted phosphodiesterase